MHRIKKIVCCVLAVILIFSLMACKENRESGVKEFDEVKESVIDYSDMELSGKGNAFKAENVGTPFYTDREDNVIYTINVLWRRFGNVSDGVNAVHLMGNEPSWYEWMTNKFLWSDEESSIERLLDMIAGCPQSANGYVWSWGSREYWLVENTFGETTLDEDAVSFHYDGTFRFVGAVYDVIANQNSTDFLSRKDLTRINNRDASVNLTVREKLDKAVNFILEELGGKNGYITLPNDMDISPPMKNYAKNYGNTGKLGSNSANYWDNYCYGHISAYENQLFYQMLLKLRGIEKMCQNEARAAEIENLAEKTKNKYDELFFDSAKERYINSVDVDGNRHDYGLTFQNTEALTYGLSDKEKAKSIFSWLDGTREIEGDTSVKEDIYAYKLAPRTNTVAIESKIIEGKSWWRAPDSINVQNNGNASWDKHQTNGGFIFYSEYYDIMSRLKYIGPESFIKRWNVIFSEFKVDGLMRREGWRYGINAEFPENGIVPMSFLNGLMGVEPSYRGLEIEPVFPSAYTKMGVTKYNYGGKYYAICVEKDGTLIINSDKGIDMRLVYRPNTAKSNFTLRVYNGSGVEIEKMNLSKNAQFELEIDLSIISESGAVSVVVS